MTFISSFLDIIWKKLVFGKKSDGGGDNGSIFEGGKVGVGVGRRKVTMGW